MPGDLVRVAVQQGHRQHERAVARGSGTTGIGDAAALDDERAVLEPRHMDSDQTGPPVDVPQADDRCGLIFPGRCCWA